MSVPSQIELIEAAYARVKATGPYDFARKLELGPDGYQRYRRWKTAGAGLAYKDTMKMLEVLGWLQTEPSPADLAEEFVRRLDAGEKVSVRQMERVAAQVEELSEKYRRLADRLQAGVQAAAK